MDRTISAKANSRSDLSYRTMRLRMESEFNKHG